MPSTTRTDTRRARRARKRRPWLVWGISAVLLGICAVVAWVGIRAYLAKGELEAALPLASQLKSQVASGDARGAAASVEAVTAHAKLASELTSDPVWRAAEIVPWVGANLRVMRELASTVDDVSRDGLEPLSSLAGSIQLSSFKPVDGRVDLQPMLDARGVLSESSNAVGAAVTRTESINADGAIQPLVDARQKLLEGLTEASSGLSLMSTATQLIPAMLGSDGPRNYLVLFQNNAELRSTGGIPGALALLKTENGVVGLGQQSAASQFPRYASPVVALPPETQTLYGDNTAQYMQDVNFTPNFALSGQIAREMWKQQYGTEADGVISLDPVALSYLLRATGPVTLATGDELNSDNAVTLLLQDVYARYVDPADQDAFFASAAAEVFSKVASGDVDPLALIDALAKAGDENRVLIWSAHDEDQALLAGTSLAGGLPQSTDMNQKFGVYFNDSTTAKMDPYLKVSFAAGQVVCRKDGLPLNSVRVTLTNIAPADSATALPDYVTGGGLFGIPPGNIRTNIAAYGAGDLYNMGVARDGERIPYRAATDSGYGVSKLEIEIAPGESTTLDFQFLGNDTRTGAVSVQHTPFVYPVETTPLAMTCDDALE